MSKSMVATTDRITFVVGSKSDGAVIGTSSYLQIYPVHRTLEIGATFYRPKQRGTAVNLETKLLMLTEAFDAGALRVKFSVSTLNTRSRRHAQAGRHEGGRDPQSPHYLDRPEA